MGSRGLGGLLLMLLEIGAPTGIGLTTIKSDVGMIRRCTGSAGSLVDSRKLIPVWGGTTNRRRCSEKKKYCYEKMVPTPHLILQRKDYALFVLDIFSGHNEPIARGG